MGRFCIKASLKYWFSHWVHSTLLSTLRGHQKIKFRVLTLWGQLWIIPGSLGTPDQGNDSHWGAFPTQVIRDVHSQSEWIHPGFLESVKENAEPSAHSFPQNGLVYQVFCEGRSASYCTHTHTRARTHTRTHTHTRVLQLLVPSMCCIFSQGQLVSHPFPCCCLVAKLCPLIPILMERFLMAQPELTLNNSFLVNHLCWSERLAFHVFPPFNIKSKRKKKKKIGLFSHCSSS